MVLMMTAVGPSLEKSAPSMLLLFLFLLLLWLVRNWILETTVRRADSNPPPWMARNRNPPNAIATRDRRAVPRSRPRATRAWSTCRAEIPETVVARIQCRFGHRDTKRRSSRSNHGVSLFLRENQVHFPGAGSGEECTNDNGNDNVVAMGGHSVCEREGKDPNEENGVGAYLCRCRCRCV